MMTYDVVEETLRAFVYLVTPREPTGPRDGVWAKIAVLSTPQRIILARAVRAALTPIADEILVSVSNVAINAMAGLIPAPMSADDYNSVETRWVASNKTGAELVAMLRKHSAADPVNVDLLIDKLLSSGTS